VNSKKPISDVMPEIMIIECPFCKEKTIKIMHSPEVYTTQTIRVGSNRKTIPNLTKAKDEVLSEKCSNCEKSRKEIQKALKEGPKMSHEELLKRIKEAGLPTKIG
jgi:hypothetical protein